MLAEKGGHPMPRLTPERTRPYCVLLLEAWSGDPRQQHILTLRRPTFSGGK